jgi:NADP-dependent 3-hydroxy acid dehydrogenase YdfG
MVTLANQVVLISGASGGIGSAVTRALSDHHVRSIIVGRNHAKLDALANTCEGSRYVSADLTDDLDIAKLGDLLANEYGHIDILIHCAGVIDHGSIEDAPITALDRQYQANVRGPLLLTKTMLPLLKNPRGQVVFINSSRGLQATANNGHFSATQHAFKAIADSLREEVNPQDVRVLSVFTGRTATPRIKDLDLREGRIHHPELLLQPEDIASVVINALSLPWTAEVTEISIRPMRKPDAKFQAEKIIAPAHWKTEVPENRSTIPGTYFGEGQEGD